MIWPSGTSIQKTAPSAFIERAQVGVDERPAAGRDHHVPGRQQLLHDLAFDGAEVRLAVRREDRRDGPALARLDAVVDVLDAPAEAAADLASERGLARGHEPDQVDLVRPHWRSLSSVSKNPGYEIATDSAPRIRDSPRGAERGDGEGHGQPVVAGRVGRAARQPAAARDDEPVVALFDVRAERPQARDEHRDAVALFHAELAGAAHREPAPEGRQRGQRGKFVDEAGNLGREDLDGPQRLVPHRDGAARLAARLVAGLHAHARAHAREDVEERRPRRVQADALEHDGRARDALPPPPPRTRPTTGRRAR